MKNKSQALLVLMLGLAASQSHAEVAVISSEMAQNISKKFGSDALFDLADAGVIFQVKNDDTIYLRASRAKKILREIQGDDQSKSTVDILKNILKGASTIKNKDLEKTILGTQDYRGD
jgi:hypothetical protein